MKEFKHSIPHIKQAHIDIAKHKIYRMDISPVTNCFNFTNVEFENELRTEILEKSFFITSTWKFWVNVQGCIKVFKVDTNNVISLDSKLTEKAPCTTNLYIANYSETVFGEPNYYLDDDFVQFTKIITSGSYVSFLNLDDMLLPMESGSK